MVGKIVALPPTLFIEVFQIRIEAKACVYVYVRICATILVYTYGQTSGTAPLVFIYL